MSGVVLYDDARARRFEPFALTRPLGEMRAGALLVRERWERTLGVDTIGFVGAPQLADFDEPGAAQAIATIPRGAVVANTRFAPALRAGESKAARWHADGRVAAVRVGRELAAEELAAADGDLDALPRAAGGDARLEGTWLDEVWELVATLSEMLCADIPALGSGLRRLTAHDAILIGDHPVFVADGAIVEPHVCFDVRHGPVLIERGGTVQAFSRVVGPCYVGEESIVTTDRVAGCSIGPHSKVHGEMSVTVVLGYSNKGHGGFVGHSYLGAWTNLGAETVTSNLKNTYGPVTLWTPDGIRDTGMQFLGTLFGDHVKTGINLPLTTGTVLGAGANVFGRMPPKVVAPFAWGEAGSFATYRIDKFLEVAARVMSRRSVALSERERKQLAASHAARWSA
ncbi:MAG TPA: putative sugar nucleotidyl transferase [Gemmatimonadaceae bacterium]|nr:putative sugar nucleotidyl transferase [Gemmatimonadaceae bacterium]